QPPRRRSGHTRLAKRVRDGTSAREGTRDQTTSLIWASHPSELDPKQKSREALQGRWRQKVDQSSLIFPTPITLVHFSVSLAISLAKSADVPASTMLPKPASCALILGSLSPALISRLSTSMIPGGVPFGAPIPSVVLDS